MKAGKKKRQPKWAKWRPFKIYESSSGATFWVGHKENNSMMLVWKKDHARMVVSSLNGKGKD